MVENGSLCFECFPVDCEDQRYLGTTEGPEDPVPIPALEGEAEVSQSERTTWIKNTWDTFKPMHSQARRMKWTESASLGWDVGICLWTDSPGYELCSQVSEPYLRQDFRTNLWLIWKEILFARKYNDWLYPITIPFHRVCRKFSIILNGMSLVEAANLRATVLKQPSLAKCGCQSLRAVFRRWFTASETQLGGGCLSSIKAHRWPLYNPAHRRHLICICWNKLI